MQDLLSRLDAMESKFGELPLERIARDTGFVRRSPRKADQKQWLRAICLLAKLPAKSFRTFAWLLGLIEGQRVSKQNVAKRMHAGFERFLEETTRRVIGKLSCPPSLDPDPALSSFKRIIVQDSTVVPLPGHLAGRFPGSSNQSGKPISSIRVQAFVDLLSERCLAFGISAFTRNDQRASADILDLVRAGDLVLRDLGYSSLKVFRQLTEQGAHLISRFKHGTVLFDCDGQPINLLARLKRYGHLDMPVLVGQEARVPLRLIVLPVSEAVAAERRRKARLNRDRRANPSHEHMKLLGWQIFITSIPSSQANAKTLARIYSLRWRIETIFKAWKSHFRFGVLPRYAPAAFVCSLMFATLLCVAIFQCVFQVLGHRHNHFKAHISPLKLASLIRNLQAIELQRIIDSVDEDKLLDLTLYHCLYDKRSRPNYFQVFSNLSNASLG